MSKRTIDSFFKKQVKDNIREYNDTQDNDAAGDPTSGPSNLEPEQPPPKCRRDEVMGFDINSLVRDPGLRRPIDSYHVNKRDEIRRAYIYFGPYQPHQDEYPLSGLDTHPRRFQYHWFKSFPWMEYSPTTDAAYCFPCFLFGKRPVGKQGSNTFTATGFRNWKKVNCKDCALSAHAGKDSNSAHSFAVRCYNNLANQSTHIERVIEKQSAEQVVSNRLRLTTSIDAIRWLTFQACAFRGHNESSDSNNQGNFLEMIKLLASYNEKVHAVVLENAPQNAKYTSPKIQKEILNVYARNVQRRIREEIGDAKFCLIVDESRDIAKREQMAIVLRFVDKGGYVRERFVDLVHVKDTSSLTLKNEICSVLSRHSLNVKDIRGQGYDGASNMRGEWNGLKALFLKECQYAYYVHCLGHQLQLALVAASREVPEVHTFFQSLLFIINIVTGSSKRHDELQASQIAELEQLAESGELDTGTGANQIGTLQRPGDTRWSSHFKSVCSLTRLYGPTCLVLADIAEDKRLSYFQRGDATKAVKLLMSFEFAFILHMVREIMGITDPLCQALQQKSQDIVNAMHLVRSTKQLIQKLRDEGWETLLENVKSFCEHHGIPILEMEATYVDVLKSLRI